MSDLVEVIAFRFGAKWIQRNEGEQKSRPTHVEVRMYYVRTYILARGRFLAKVAARVSGVFGWIGPLGLLGDCRDPPNITPPAGLDPALTSTTLDLDDLEKKSDAATPKNVYWQHVHPEASSEAVRVTRTPQIR